MFAVDVQNKEELVQDNHPFWRLLTIQNEEEYTELLNTVPLTQLLNPHDLNPELSNRLDEKYRYFVKQALETGELVDGKPQSTEHKHVTIISHVVAHLASGPSIKVMMRERDQTSVNPGEIILDILGSLVKIGECLETYQLGYDGSSFINEYLKEKLSSLYFPMLLELNKEYF
jgi:hypothetical protein